MSELLKIRKAIGLLNSMVLSGENHSDVSAQYVEDALNAIDKIEDTRKPDDAKWISVEERLPEKVCVCVVNYLDEDGDYDYAFMGYEVNEWWDNDNYKVDSVTHWMPLPTPPEQSSEGMDGNT